MQIAPWVFPLTEETASVPPHVRGKDTRRQHDESVRGITHACAGKRFTMSSNFALIKDHPRVCGEKGLSSAEIADGVGSPTRVRGKDSGNASAGLADRITPACAGKRAPAPRPSRSTRDHPRVRGEKSSGTSSITLHKGSPPRVRGKATVAMAAPSTLRITPACAGKRCKPDYRFPEPWDHPRVCGEKMLLLR